MMGDHLDCADELPTVEYGHAKGASSMVEAPTTTTHPPDPTYLSTPEGSPHTKDNVDVEGLPARKAMLMGAMMAVPRRKR